MTTREKINQATHYWLQNNVKFVHANYWSYNQGAMWGWNAAMDQIIEDVEKTSLPAKTKEAIQQLAEITKIL